ncbi:hypothetical protein AB6A40_005340 [Gnathostoma spinigerum]|uniref:ARMC9 CTLH-like domain-containing protein n=1 Tax=Gnathostoma spinigerum TaxID=75299 RepID=A0ABD6EHE0_9BILA
MTDGVALVDSLVRDYLAFRGMTKTLESFDAECRTERDLKFSVSRVVGELFAAIENRQIDRIREIWNYFNTKVFNNLSDEQSEMAVHLEMDIYRLYLVSCVQQKQRNSCFEFFERMCDYLRGNPSWNEWYTIPFVNDPRTHETFRMYFTKEWQQKFAVSLHNFLAIAFDRLEVPLLVQCVSVVLESNDDETMNTTNRTRRPHLASLSEEVMDDFSIIAQGPKNRTSSKSSLRALLRNITSKRDKE